MVMVVLGYHLVMVLLQGRFIIEQGIIVCKVYFLLIFSFLPF